MIKIQNPASWILPIAISFSLYSGLIKALTGNRYFPLLVDFIILGLLTVWLGARIYKNKLSVGKLDVIAMIFIILSIVWMFHPNIPSLQAGLEGFRKFTFMFIGFFVGRFLLDIKSLKRLVYILIANAIIISIYGIKQFLLPTSMDYRLIEISTASPITYMMGGHIRAFSSLPGPFHLGLFLMAILLLGATFWQYYSHKRILIAITMLPLLAALIFTVTKSNWIATLLGTIFLIFLNSKHLFRFLGRGVLLGIIILVLLYLGMQFVSSLPFLTTVYDGLQAFFNPFSAPTMLVRYEIWGESIIPKIINSPWFGYGTGSAGEGLQFLFTDGIATNVSAHNIFLKVLIEMGLIGLIIFITFLFFIFLSIWRNRSLLNSDFLRVFSDWSLAFFVGVMAAGMTGSILDAYPVNLLFWIVLGVATNLSKFEINIEKFDKKDYRKLKNG